MAKVFVAFYFCTNVVIKSFDFRIKMFGPIPRRLLTEEEFEAESDSYTQMEMEKLKEFCRNSPSTKNWKMISRLSNPRK